MALLVAVAAGACRKKAERPSAPPPALVEAASPPAAPAGTFVAADLVRNARLGDLWITASYPENLALEVGEKWAKLTAPGFYPVRITVEPLTLQNAVMKVSVDGMEQLIYGSTSDGQAKVYQTKCWLVRCFVDYPAEYRDEVADVGRAICDSIAEIPPPTEGYLRQLRDAASSFGGPCAAEDRARQAIFQEAVRRQDVREAVEACWREATAREEWRSARPVVRVGWSLSHDERPRWRVVLGALEGDTSVLQSCFEQALEPARTALPADARTSRGCIATFTAAYDLDHRPICPG